MCKIGDIYMAQLQDNKDTSLQAGARPVIIVSNDKANEFSPVITIIPLTSKMSKKKLPTHVYMNDCGLDRPSIALVEQITALSKACLINWLGSIKETQYEKQIRRAIEIQLSM